MMKIRKRAISLLTMILVLCSSFSAFAQDTASIESATKTDEWLEQNTDNSSEYFRFSERISRMDENGNFVFSYKDQFGGDTFKPNGSSITVYASATSSTSDTTYYISLYKADRTLVKSNVKYTADGSTYKYSFTGLSSSTSYYLYFSKPLKSRATITGSGRIDSIAS